MAEAGEAPPPPAAGEAEIDLESYQIDSWDLDEELLLQQQKKANGFLVVGKPGTGKANLAALMTNKLGVVHVGFQQVIFDAMAANEARLEVEAAKAELAKLVAAGEHQDKLKAGAEERAAKAAEGGEAAAAAEGGGEGEGEGEGEAGEQAPKEVFEEPEDADATAARVARMGELQGVEAEEGSGVLEGGIIPSLEERYAAIGAPDIYIDVASTLRSGGAVSGSKLSELVKARIGMDDVSLRGYVLDGVPPGDFDVGVLHGEGVQTPLTFIIEIRSDDATVLRRLSQFRLDASPKPLGGGASGGEGEEGAPAPEPRVYSPEDQTPGSHQPLVEAENPEDPEGPPLKNEDGSVMMVHWEPKPEWADNLLMRACDRPKLAEARLGLEWYSVVESEKYKAMAESVLPMNKIVLDGSLTPVPLLNSLIAQLPFPFLPLVVLPKRVYDAESDPEAATLDGAMAAGSDERTGPLRLSLWGEFCPVALHQGAGIVKGKPFLSVSYAGRLFVLSTPERCDKFMANPKPFLQSTPKPPQVRVMLLGPPSSGKTSIAKHLSSRYGCVHVDMVASIEEAAADETRRESAPIKQALVAGEPVPPKSISDVLARALGLPARPETPRKEEAAPAAEGGEEGEGEGEAAAAAGGGEEEVPPAPTFPSLGEDGSWGKAPEGQEGMSFVVEDFPCTAQALEEMRRACMVPTVVLVLQDSSEEGKDLQANLGKSGASDTPSRTAQWERDHGGLSVPIPAMASATAAAFAEAEPLLVEAGCTVVKLSCNVSVGELIESAAARVDPFVYGRVIQDGCLGGASVELPDPALGDDGKPIYPPETPTLQVMGWYKTFCPVMLRREGALVPGSRLLSATFRGLIYLCSSEAAREAFIANPSYFAVAPSGAVPSHQVGEGGIPPPLIMIIGADGSGKEALATDIAESNNLSIIKLESALPASRPPPPPQELAEGEEPAPFDPEWTDEECLDMCKALRTKLASPPYSSSRGVILEGAPLSEKYTSALLAALLHPVAAFFVSIEDAGAVSRLYGVKNGAYPKPHRLPFYPFLDQYMQRRDIRVLKALGIQVPNPSPKDEEGKPVEPKPTDEELKEAALAAEEAVKALITTKNQGFSASSAAMRASLEAALVPCKAINAESAYPRQASAISGTISPFLAHRLSALAAPVAITLPKAAALLELGRRNFSKFGMACPVSLLEQGTRRLGPSVMAVADFAAVLSPPPAEGEDVPPPAAEEAFPVLFGPHIYFARTEVARKRFIANPVRHMQQPQAQPRASQRVVVTGPPKSGKTRFAELVSRELGLELMTAASCVSEVMGEVSGLGKSVRSALYAGNELDEESLSAAVVAACRRRSAWVLDGFPVTPGQAAVLEAAGLGITSCVTVSCSDAACKSRADAQLDERGPDGMWRLPRAGYVKPGDPAADPPTEDTEVPPELPVLNGSVAIQGEMEGWKESESGVVRELTAGRDIEVRVDGEGGKAKEGQALRAIVQAAEEGRQAFLESKILLRPSPMHMQHMWTQREALMSSRGCFSDRTQGQGDYCSVCWREKGDLVLCAADTEMRMVVEHNGKLFSSCSPACNRRLLSAAARYTKEEPPLTKALPKALNPEEAAAVKEEELMYKGHCPVTFRQGPPKGEPIQAALHKATEPLIAVYEGKHYRMLDAERLGMFMRRPHEYTSLKLPVKLPFDKAPAKVETLPLIGYLEETVVASMQEALVDVGRLKPRYPCSGNKESALIYLSLYLRAHNKHNSVLEKERRDQAMADYVAACDLLTRNCVDLAAELGVSNILPSPVPADSETVAKFHEASLKTAYEFVLEETAKLRAKAGQDAPEGPEGGG